MLIMLYEGTSNIGWFCFCFFCLFFFCHHATFHLIPILYMNYFKKCSSEWPLNGAYYGKTLFVLCFTDQKHILRTFCSTFWNVFSHGNLFSSDELKKLKTNKIYPGLSICSLYVLSMSVWFLLTAQRHADKANHLFLNRCKSLC